MAINKESILLCVPLNGYLEFTTQLKVSIINKVLYIIDYFSIYWYLLEIIIYFPIY